jgi:hypothetical protein
VIASRAEAIRRALGARVAQGFFEGASRLGGLHPRARPEAHGVEVIRNVPYDPSHPARRLDVWKPPAVVAGATAPALLYVHGGGFRILSKETHWVMALSFARRGFVVFNIDYRLAPRHPFPAAVEDAAAAYAWVVAHAKEFGADVSRLVLAGESAGANLVAALTVAACFERASVPCPVSADVRADLWVKLVMNCVFNPISALGRARYARLVGDEATRALMRDVIAECDAVAAADGVRLAGTDALLRDTLALGHAMAQATSSTAQDLAAGRPTEIDSLNGYVARRGEALGVPTPVNRALRTLVRLAEGG